MRGPGTPHGAAGHTARTDRRTHGHPHGTSTGTCHPHLHRKGPCPPLQTRAVAHGTAPSLTFGLPVIPPQVACTARHGCDGSGVSPGWLPAVTPGGPTPQGAPGARPTSPPVLPHSEATGDGTWCHGVTVWPRPLWAGTLRGHCVSSVPVAEQTPGHIRWLHAQGRDTHRHSTCPWQLGMAWSHRLHWSCMGMAPRPALSHRRAVTCQCHLLVPLCHLLLPGCFCANLSHLPRDEPVKPSQ